MMLYINALSALAVAEAGGAGLVHTAIAADTDAALVLAVFEEPQNLTATEQARATALMGRMHLKGEWDAVADAKRFAESEAAKSAAAAVLRQPVSPNFIGASASVQRGSPVCKATGGQERSASPPPTRVRGPLSLGLMDIPDLFDYLDGMGHSEIVGKLIAEIRDIQVLREARQPEGQEKALKSLKALFDNPAFTVYLPRSPDELSQALARRQKRLEDANRFPPSLESLEHGEGGPGGYLDEEVDDPIAWAAIAGVERAGSGPRRETDLFMRGKRKPK